MRSLIPLTIANLKSYLRDRSGMFWTLAFPVVFVVLFGMIYSGTSNPTYALGWVDEDGSAASAGLRSAFAGVTVIDLKAADREASLESMRKGDVVGVIVVPKGYGAALGAPVAGAGPAASGPAGASGSASGSAASDSGSPSASGAGSASASATPAVLLTLFTDPSHPTTAGIVQQIVGQVVTGVNQGITRAPTLIGVESKPLQTENLSNVAYIVPSILAMALMQLGLFGAIPLVEQRQKLIFKRLGATPLKRATLVGSNVVVRLLIGLVQAVLIIGIGAAAFNVAILGNLLLVAFLVVLGALAFISLGYVVASFARTEETASAATSILQFPLMFLSGIFFPFEMMPPFMKAVGAIMPLTYLGDALRQVMVHGSAFAPLAVDVAVLGGWLVVCLGISARFFSWQ